EDVRGVFHREGADADDAVAPEGQVALEGGPAAAVNQGDVAEDVVGLDGVGAGQGQKQAQGRGGKHGWASKAGGRYGGRFPVRRGLVEGRRGRTIVKGNSFGWGGAFGRGRLPVCKEPWRVARRCQEGREKEATDGAGDGPLGAGVRGLAGLDEL